jgi:hypothetical protein
VIKIDTRPTTDGMGVGLERDIRPL